MNNPLPCMLVDVNNHMRFKFVHLIFLHDTMYEIISTTTIYGNWCILISWVHVIAAGAKHTNTYYTLTNSNDL